VAEDRTEWISYRTAAELTGLSKATLHWWAQRGQIRRRSAPPGAPTLDRASVLDFAARRRSSAHLVYAPRLPRTPPPAPTGWITAREAGDRLGRSTETILRYIKTGRLTGEIRGDRPGARLGWVTEASVTRLDENERKWISHTEAASLIGCTVAQVLNLIAHGRLRARKGPRRYPSINRASAEAARDWWADAVRARADAESTRRQARPASAPPDDGRVWLTPAQAAEILRVTVSTVHQQARDERLPAYRRGHRWWIRADHLAQVQAARLWSDRARPT